MYGDDALLHALLPVLSKSVGNVCAAPDWLTYCRFAAATPLCWYCVFTAFIGFGPTVVSLEPTHRNTFWFATFAFASIWLPLQLLMSVCIVDSCALEIDALYMHAV